MVIELPGGTFTWMVWPLSMILSGAGLYANAIGGRSVATASLMLMGDCVLPVLHASNSGFISPHFAGPAVPEYRQCPASSFAAETPTHATTTISSAAGSIRMIRFIAPPSSVEPRRGEAAAVVVAEVRSVVLQRALPHRDRDRRGDLDVVLLLRQMPLQLREELAPLHGVCRPALAHEQIGDDRIVDVALVLQLLRIVHPVDEVIGIEERRLRPVRHRIELAEVAAGDERAVLALVELRLDADLLEIPEEELRGVDERGRAVGGEAETR